MKKLIIPVIAGVTLWAGTVAADLVTLDDTIIDGSLCVGVDCVNGETFNFNTLVLKENNLRIRFQDTSNSASFPTRDWVLEANASTNGGGEYFAIVDHDGSVSPLMVFAGAPHGALTVTDGGVGLGVDPATSLHVTDGDTPTLRIEQTGAEGWQPQAWDVGGNESNFFIRDTTSGTLPLRMEPGAPNDSILILSSGNVEMAGTLSQGSSRYIKTGIVPAKPTEVLERVRGLVINRWQYRADPSGVEHLGPMAEDFHAAFGLGANAQHLAASDVASVAVASVQALNHIVEEQARELEALKQQNAALEARLKRIEAMLSEQ